MSEDLFNFLIKVEISDLQWVLGASEVVLKLLVFGSSKLKFLGIESGSELCGLNSSLSKWVMILEEFSNSNSVSHNVFFNLLHECIDLSRSTEINVEVDISGPGTRVWLIDHILETSSISDEWQVFNISELVCISSDA